METDYDLVIIGGGVNGAGIARDAAGRGMSVLLVEALTDAIAVGSLFSIITRYADALDFALPTDDEFDRAASMLLKRGYAS